jgi:hypothetical protein
MLARANAMRFTRCCVAAVGVNSVPMSDSSLSSPRADRWHPGGGGQGCMLLVCAGHPPLPPAPRAVQTCGQ